MTSFVHITDLHISNPDKEEPHLLSDTNQIVTDTLGRINALAPRPDFVIVSGDLANHGDPVAYEWMKNSFTALDMPVLFALGNHDNRPVFREAFLGETENLNAPYCYDQEVAGVHVISLDSSVPGNVYGTIEPEQFDWLETALTRHQDLPRVVIVHHPPMMGGEVHPLEHLEIADSEKLAEMLQNQNVIGVFSGHVHHDRTAIWHGIPVFIGNGCHNRMDPTYTEGLRATDGVGMVLVNLREHGITVDFIPEPNEGRELMKMTGQELLEALIGEFTEEEQGAA